MVPVGIKEIAEGIKLVPEGIQMVPVGIKMVPEGIKIVPDGIKMVPDGISMVPEGINMVPKSIKIISEGINTVPMGNKMVPEGIKMVPDDIKMIPEDIKMVPEGIKMISFEQHQYLRTLYSLTHCGTNNSDPADTCVWQKRHQTCHVRGLFGKSYTRDGVKNTFNCKKIKIGKSYTLGTGNTGAIMFPTRSMQELHFS